MNWQIAAFYKFVPLPAPEEVRARIETNAAGLGLCGTVLVASEGLNGTIAGHGQAVQQFVQALAATNEIGALSVKYSSAAEKPFGMLKVRIKKEIVTFGAPGSDPRKQVGTYVAPEDWDALIGCDDVVLIDTRNSYEVGIGTFRGAIDPGTRSFREFPSFVKGNLDPTRHKRVAMFCTGGIRCEKATAYMLSQGFEQVYHLDGGILNYLACGPKERSSWVGECFVFDERVSVDHDLKRGSYVLCESCGVPVEKTQKQAQCANCMSVEAGRGKSAATAE